MIVEYCKYGNLQRYISSKRETFISQINPQTGHYEDQYPPDLDILLKGYDRWNNLFEHCVKYISFRYFETIQYASLSFLMKPEMESAVKPLTQENLTETCERSQSSSSILDNEVFLNLPQTNGLRHPRCTSANSTGSEFMGTVRTETTGLTSKYQYIGNLMIIILCHLYVLTLDTDLENCSDYAKLICNQPRDDPNSILNSEIEDLGPITTKHLLGWAYQVAKGMEYLSSKKVEEYF